MFISSDYQSNSCQPDATGSQILKPDHNILINKKSFTGLLNESVKVLHYRQVLSRNPALMELNPRVCAVLEHSQPFSMFLAAVKCKWSTCSDKSFERVYLVRQGGK